MRDPYPCERQGREQMGSRPSLCFYNSGHFRVTIYCLLRCLLFVRKPCLVGLVPCDTAMCGLCPVPSADPHILPWSFPLTMRSFWLVVKFDLFVGVILGHVILVHSLW